MQLEVLLIMESSLRKSLTNRLSSLSPLTLGLLQLTASVRWVKGGWKRSAASLLEGLCKVALMYW